MAENIIDAVIRPEKSRKLVRRIIPVLIGWACAGMTDKTYGDLIRRLGYKKFSGIGRQLIFVQRVITTVAHDGKMTIPTLNSLVKNRKTGLPSKGLGEIFPGYESMDAAGKKAFTEKLDEEAVNFDKWDMVLKVLGLNPVGIKKDASPLSLIGR